MKKWKDSPGEKVAVPLWLLRIWEQQMANSKEFENDLREHARDIRKQLAALEAEKAKPGPRPPLHQS